MAGPFGADEFLEDQKIDLSALSYSASGVRRQPIKEELARELREAVTAVYGPDYRVDIMSAAQPSGPRGTKGTTGSRRHGTGVAADVWVYSPDGRKLAGDELVPLSQHWLATKKGSVGFPAKSGQSIHLDLIGGKGPGAVPLGKGEGRLWYYGSPSQSQRSALNSAIAKGTTPKYAISPEAVRRGYVPPGSIAGPAPTPAIMSASLGNARSNPPPVPARRPTTATPAATYDRSWMSDYGRVLGQHQPVRPTEQASLGPPQFTNWQADYNGLIAKAPRPERLPGRQATAEPLPQRTIAGTEPQAATPSTARTGKLPSGKTVEQGQVYRVGDSTYIGEVSPDGTGSLKKFDPGIVKEAGTGSAVGGMVDAYVKKAVGEGVQKALPAATSAARSVGEGAGRLVGAVGDLASGPSAALASALERLGRASAAKKGPVTVADVRPRPERQRGRPANPSITMEFERRGSQSRPVTPVSQGIAASVPQGTAAGVLQQSIKAASPKPTQAQMQAMRHVPKYLTKTRRVPIENEVEVAENNSLSAVPRGVIMNSLSRDSVAQRAAGKAAAQQMQFRTETYQVPNPDYQEITVPYNEPAGPTPAQIEAEKRRVQEAYEAQRKAEMAAKQKQIKYLSNTNAEHRAALESGKSGYIAGGGRVMPTRAMNGKVRNSYGDSGGSTITTSSQPKTASGSRARLSETFGF